MKTRVQVRAVRSADTASPLFGARAPAIGANAEQVFDCPSAPTHGYFASTDTLMSMPAPVDDDREQMLMVYFPTATDEVAMNWYTAFGTKFGDSPPSLFTWAGGYPQESHVVDAPPVPSWATVVTVRGLWVTTMDILPEWVFAIAPTAAGAFVYLEGDIEADIGVWPQPTS